MASSSPNRGSVARSWCSPARCAICSPRCAERPWACRSARPSATAPSRTTALPVRVPGESIVDRLVERLQPRTPPIIFPRYVRFPSGQWLCPGSGSGNGFSSSPLPPRSKLMVFAGADTKKTSEDQSALAWQNKSQKLPGALACLCSGESPGWVIQRSSLIKRPRTA